MSRDTTLLHPELQEIIKSFLTDCQKAGLPVLITETLRTAAEQDALYAQGRTKPGAIVTQCRGADFSSCHQWGVAFDFCRNVKGAEFNDNDGFFKKVGSIGKLKGLEWGGDWSGFADKPHLQMKRFSPDGSASWLKKNYGTPQAFIKTWGASGAANASASAIQKEGAEMLSVMKISVDGKVYDVQSVLRDDLNYPNLRALMEILKYDVAYSEQTKTVTLRKK